MPPRNVAKTTAKAAKGPARVVRLHEASGSSSKGWPAAVGDALRRSKADVPRPLAVEVVRQWGDVAAGGITRFHVTVRIAWAQTLKAPPATRTRPAK